MSMLKFIIHARVSLVEMDHEKEILHLQTRALTSSSAKPSSSQTPIRTIRNGMNNISPSAYRTMMFSLLVGSLLFCGIIELAWDVAWCYVHSARWTVQGWWNNWIVYTSRIFFKKSHQNVSFGRGFKKKSREMRNVGSAFKDSHHTTETIKHQIHFSLGFTPSW